MFGGNYTRVVLLTCNIGFIIENGCNIGPAAVRRVASAYFNNITVLVAEIVRTGFPAYIEAGIKCRTGLNSVNNVCIVFAAVLVTPISIKTSVIGTALKAAAVAPYTEIILSIIAEGYIRIFCIIIFKLGIFNAVNIKQIVAGIRPYRFARS